MKKILLVLAFLFVSCCCLSFGDTYYIDYSATDDSQNGTSKSTPWKRAPGMVGFAGSYSHTAGDVFIFKGGEVWPSAVLPWSISYSGTSGNIDTYTTDQTWYTGESWSQPTIDGENQGASIGNYMIIAEDADYWKFNDIEIIDFYQAEVAGDGYMFQIEDCEQVEISNCTFAPQCWLGLYFVYITGSDTYSVFSVHDSDFSKVSQGIAIAVTGSSTTTEDFDIYDNLIHDLADQINDGTHGDGIHTWVNQATSQLTDVKVYRNKFYGALKTTDGTAGLTAWVFYSDRTNNTYTYNNTFTYSDTEEHASYTLFTSMVSYHGAGENDGTHYLYENTFYGHDYPDVTANRSVYVQGTADYIYIKNNIFTGYRWMAEFTSALSNLTSDYNCINEEDPSNYVVKWGASYDTFSDWKTRGYDTNSKNTDPDINTTTLKLNSISSPPYDAGEALGGIYNEDLERISRPQGGGWDMGAYEYLASRSSGRTANTVASQLLNPLILGIVLSLAGSAFFIISLFIWFKARALQRKYTFLDDPLVWDGVIWYLESKEFMNRAGGGR
ncbi:MAG: choice-of-anchor Q domain-containing protein [Candidatus Hermodarchaeia archaeon]